jgi:uncharacterized membrane protein
MEWLLKVSIWVHVAAGITALLSGVLAYLFRKKKEKHKKAGKIYFLAMSIIFVTGVFLSVVKGLLFFFFIAVFTFYLALVAKRAFQLKGLLKGEKVSLTDYAIQIISGLTFIGLISLGVYAYAKSGSWNAIIPVFFGAIGMSGVIQNLRLYRKVPEDKMFWLKIHVGNMMGSYIGAITAFLVNQSEYFPIPPYILWLAPTFIVLPLMRIELKKIGK